MRKYNYMRLSEDELFRLGMLSHLEKPVEDRYMDGDPTWWEEDEEWYQELVKYEELGYEWSVSRQSLRGANVSYPIGEPGWSKPSEEWWLDVLSE